MPEQARQGAAVRSFLAFDFGTRRVGVASGNTVLGFAQPLRTIAADPTAAAVKHGKVSGCCCFCARPLTDAGSVEHGYGPTCAEKYGLPWQSKTSRKFVEELCTA